MSELTVVRGPGKGSSIALTPDRSVTIGASAEAGIRVGGSGVAGEQVVVKALKGGGFGVKSLAGSFELNGRATEAARLRDGDVLAVGDTRIRYADEAATVADEIVGFRLLGVLGRGGWGVVYRAEQKSLGREVALKVLSKERLDDPMFVGRFQAEARAAARLHHPNVVQVFDVDHDGGRWFYSMELMHGGSLEQRVKREGRLPIEDAVRAISDAARGLAFAEQMRIVHRDIKPDNLMVDRHGHVKIADLGLALTDEDGGTKIVGTPHFIAPEQVRKQLLDHRSDLYALGCTFYRLATGRTPFQGDSVKQILRAQLEEDPTPAHQIASEIPVAVSEVIARLMQKDPDQRYQSATELLESLDHLLAPPARRSIWVALAAAVALIAAIVAVVIAANQDDTNGGTTVTETEYVVDPEAQRAIEENRRIEAENALLRVQTQGLGGAALAAALEKVAEDHAGTDAGGQAGEQAARIRTDLELQAQADARRKAVIEAAIDALNTAFDAAFEAGDLPAAAGVLAGRPANPETDDAPALVSARAELTERLNAASEDRLRTLRATVDAAIAAKDPAAARAALGPLDAVAGPEGWPDAILPNRAELQKYAADARARADAIEIELAEAAQAEAWAGLRAAILGPDGVVTAVRAMRFADAATILDTAATDHRGFAAGARATALAPAFHAAASYFDAFSAAVATGDLEIVDPRNGERVPVTAFDPATGLSIKTGPRIRPKTELVAIDEVLAHAPSWFVELPAATPGSRAALLGALAITRHVGAAASYLGALRAGDDATGTGAQAYSVAHGTIEPAITGLSGVDQDWARVMAEELRAASQLAQTLSALSARRNLTAAGLAERLLAESSGTMVVRSLL